MPGRGDPRHERRSDQARLGPQHFLPEEAELLHQRHRPRLAGGEAVGDVHLRKLEVSKQKPLRRGQAHGEHSREPCQQSRAEGRRRREPPLARPQQRRQPERRDERRMRDAKADGQPEQHTTRDQPCERAIPQPAELRHECEQHEQQRGLLIPRTPGRVREDGGGETERDRPERRPPRRTHAPSFRKGNRAHQHDDAHGTGYGESARGEQRMRGPAEDLAIDEGEIRRVEVRIIAIRQKPLARPEHARGDVLMLVVAEPARHREIEEKRQRQRAKRERQKDEG